MLLRGPYWQNFIVFIICFYAIMHKRTIYKIKLSALFVLAFFFCPANIYIPSLGKVRLGRTNPNQSQSLNIYPRMEIKRRFYSEFYALQCVAVQFSIFPPFFFKLIVKPDKMFNYIYNNY